MQIEIKAASSHSVAGKTNGCLSDMRWPSMLRIVDEYVLLTTICPISQSMM
jgi:hypothetical protein